MTLTLWRGEQLLGELRTRPPSPHARPQPSDKPPSLSAFLVPSANGADLRGVWQLHFPIPGLGVQQHSVEPDIVAQRDQRAAMHRANHGPVALEPMSPEQVKGVPPEMQLTVRDMDGRIFLPRQIRLEEVRYEPAHHEVALREAPAEALIDGSIWRVFIAFL